MLRKTIKHLLVGTIVALACISQAGAEVQMLQAWPKVMLVGTVEQGTLNGGTNTLTLPGPPATDDRVLVACTYSEIATQSLTGDSSGAYTKVHSVTDEGEIVFDLYQQTMGATPDTTASTADCGATDDACACVGTVWRLMQTTDDATLTSASNTSGSPDPASITTTRPEVPVLAFCGSNVADTTVTEPTDFQDLVDVSVDETTAGNDETTMFAWRRNPITGALNPGTFAVTSEEWFCATMALRPIGK